MKKCMPGWCCTRKMESSDNLDETEIYEIQREEQKVPEIVVTAVDNSQANFAATSIPSEKRNECCEFMKVPAEKEEKVGIMALTPTPKGTFSNKGVVQNIDIDFEIPSLSLMSRRLQLLNAALQAKAHRPSYPHGQVLKQTTTLSLEKELEQNFLRPDEFHPSDVRRRLAAFRPNAADEGKN